MPGRILKYEELSSPEFAALDKNKTVVFLPVSPLEGHGPHLPVGVDYFDAIYFAESLAKEIINRNPEFDAIHYPALPFGTQVYHQDGSIRIKPTTMFELIKGIGESLASNGFKYVFLLSGHGSPKDIVAIETACIKVSKKAKIQMHNLSGALAVRFLKGEFNEKISELMDKPLTETEKNQLSKDIHGGWWETSMMLLLKPELVNSSYKTLPDNQKNPGSKTDKPGYYGSPSKGSAEFAEISLKVLSEEVLQTAEQCINGQDISEKSTSSLYKIKLLRPNFKRKLAVNILVVIKSLVIVWLIYKYFIR
jgi:creatinine amidohydrolase